MGVDQTASGAERAQRADAERNRARIVEVAIELLGADPGASMSDIAAASGVVRATVYRHFSSRDELLRAIYVRAIADADKAIRAAEPHRGRAREAIVRLLRAVVEVSDRYRVLSQERRQFPELNEQAIEVAAPVIALMERGQREGELDEDASPAWLAAVLFSLADESQRAVARGDLGTAGAEGAVISAFLRGASARPRRA